MSDLSNIGNNCKAKLHVKKTKPDTVSIKIVDTNYSNNEDKVVIGTGLAIFLIPHVHLAKLKKKVKRLVELGVLKRQPTSEWAAPTFIIPK